MKLAFLQHRKRPAADRAICRAFQQLAEVIESYEDSISSPGYIAFKNRLSDFSIFDTMIEVLGERGWPLVPHTASGVDSHLQTTLEELLALAEQHRPAKILRFLRENSQENQPLAKAIHHLRHNTADLTEAVFDAPQRIADELGKIPALDPARIKENRGRTLRLIA